VTSYLPVVVIALGAFTAPFGCALTLAMFGDLQVRAEFKETAAANAANAANATNAVNATNVAKATNAANATNAAAAAMAAVPVSPTSDERAG
jgi:hypothetical protein